MVLRGFIYAPPGSRDAGALPDGAWNTGRIDLDAQPGFACVNPDPRQFSSLADMLAYATAHGETIRQFNNVGEVNAICGSSPLSQTPATPNSTAATPGGNSSMSGCAAGTCGPVVANQNPVDPGNTVSNGTGVNTPGGTTAVAGMGTPNGSPLSGTLGGSPVVSAGTASTATPTTTTSTGFDPIAFIKSPMGILTLIVVIVIIALAR